MTLVRNRLPQLSGNKWLLCVAIGLLAACSPKVRPVVTQPKPVEPSTEKEPVQAPVKPAVAPATVISLLLPFQLNKVDLSRGAPRATLAKANLAMEYYQGFKLALDSLSADGRNFKLQVYDSQEDVARAHNLALETKVRTSALIVGPVYPDQIKSFSLASPNLSKMVVSPLSPASVLNYKNPHLITVIPPLEYHSWKAAEYIQTKLKPKNVFVLRSGYSDDNKYSVPFKKAIDSLGKKRIRVTEVSVSKGDFTAIMPQLSLTEQNVFVIPSTDKAFLQMTLQALDKLQKQHYPVTVFGHPSWEDATYLKPDLLQRLNTFITSGDKINYKAAAVSRFIKEYRRVYHAEPGEFAIKGFDEGMYFGNIASHNPAGTGQIDLPDHTALHNTFHFVNVPGMGYINTRVKLYRYTNFELKAVE